MKIPEAPPKTGKPKGSDKVPLDYNSLNYAREYNDKYLHWDQVKRHECGSMDPNDLWMLMKILRDSTMTSIKIGGLDLKYNRMNEFDRILHEIDMTISTGFLPSAKLDEGKRLFYSISSTMEESIASSQIEGASTTTKAAKTLLRENTVPKNRSETMVLNNYRAMQFIKTRLNEPLSPALIKEIHSIISHDTLEESEYEGSFRKDNSVAVRDALTGDIYHEPVDFADIERMISSLCNFVNDEKMFIHPIVKGIIIHFVVAYIHPFMDGNGRVSRSLFYWYVMKKGYVAIEFLSISKVIKSHRGKYDLAFLYTETDENDMTYFIRYNLEIITEAIGIFSKYYQRKVSEQTVALVGIQGYDLNVRQRSILADMIRSGDDTTVYEMAAKYAADPQCVRIDMKKLESLGLIKENGKVGHKTLYVYDGKNLTLTGRVNIDE